MATQEVNLISSAIVLWNVEISLLRVQSAFRFSRCHSALNSELAYSRNNSSPPVKAPL